MPLLLVDNMTTSDPLNDTGSNNSSLDTPAAVRIMQNVFITITTIILIFGVAGNILTIIVLSSKKLNTSSTSFYLSALAFVDLLYLVVTLSTKLVDFFIFSPSAARNLNAFLCRFSPMIHYLLTYFSCWLLVAVTIDRMIWVVLPFQAKKICTRVHAAIITALIGVLAFFSTLHFMFTMGLQEVRSGQYVCVPNKHAKYFPYADLILAMAGPFVIMLTANTAIIIKMGEVRRTRMANLRKNSNRSEDKTHSLTTMLLCVSFFFMVTSTPLLTYDIVYFAADITKLTVKNPTVGSIFFGVEKISYLFWYLNYSVHFLLYCLSGPRFREEAKRLFGIDRASHNSSSSQKVRERTYQTVATMQEDRVNVQTVDPRDPKIPRPDSLPAPIRKYEIEISDSK